MQTWTYIKTMKNLIKSATYLIHISLPSPNETCADTSQVNREIEVSNTRDNVNSMNAFIGSTVQCRRIAGQLTHGEFSSVQVNIACVVMFMFPLVCPVQSLLSTGVRSEPRENARARGGGKGESLSTPRVTRAALARLQCGSPKRMLCSVARVS